MAPRHKTAGARLQADPMRTLILNAVLAAAALLLAGCSAYLAGDMHPFAASPLGANLHN